MGLEYTTLPGDCGLVRVFCIDALVLLVGLDAPSFFVAPVILLLFVPVIT